MRHVAGNPAEDVGVARKRVGDLPQMEREALPAQEGHARRIAVLPGEIDPEEPHASGTAMLSASTVTADPPTRTRATAPSCTLRSTRDLSGRPMPSPSSAVQAARVPSAWRTPASRSQIPIEEWTEPVT